MHTVKVPMHIMNKIHTTAFQFYRTKRTGQDKMVKEGGGGGEKNNKKYDKTQ